MIKIKIFLLLSLVSLVTCSGGPNLPNKDDSESTTLAGEPSEPRIDDSQVEPHATVLSYISSGVEDTTQAGEPNIENVRYNDRDSQVLESINNYNKEKKNWPSIPDEVLEKYVILTMGLDLRKRVLKSYKTKMEDYLSLFSWEFLQYMDLAKRNTLVESLKNNQRGYKWAVLRFMNPTLLNTILSKARKDDECVKRYQKRMEKQLEKGQSSKNPKEEDNTTDFLSNIGEYEFFYSDIVGSFVETCIDGNCTFNYDYLRLTYVTQDHVTPVPTKNIVLHLRREYREKCLEEIIEEHYNPYYEDPAEDEEIELLYEELGEAEVLEKLEKENLELENLKREFKLRYLNISSENPEEEHNMNDFNSQVLESFKNYSKENKNWPSIPDEVLENCGVVTMSLELRERVLKSVQINMGNYLVYDWAVLKFLSPELLQRVLREAKDENKVSNIDEYHFSNGDIVGSFIETCIDGNCTLNYDYLRLTYVTQDHVSPVPTKNIVLHLRRDYRED